MWVVQYRCVSSNNFYHPKLLLGKSQFLCELVEKLIELLLVIISFISRFCFPFDNFIAFHLSVISFILLPILPTSYLCYMQTLNNVVSLSLR